MCLFFDNVLNKTQAILTSSSFNILKKRLKRYSFLLSKRARWEWDTSTDSRQNTILNSGSCSSSIGSQGPGSTAAAALLMRHCIKSPLSRVLLNIQPSALPMILSCFGDNRCTIWLNGQHENALRQSCSLAGLFLLGVIFHVAWYLDAILPLQKLDSQALSMSQ